MPTTKATRQTIVRLLSSMADGKEIRQYLKFYADPDHKRLAVIKVGGAILKDQLDVLGSALSFLHSVGLTPVVIHGAGPQIDAALEDAGLKTEKKDGLRITRPDAMQVIRKTFLDTNLQLFEKLEELGVPATPVTSGVFTARHLDEETYGQVGEITAVHKNPVERILAMGRIPLLLPMAESTEQTVLNINADTAANQLIRELLPHKVVFLSGTGGVLDECGQIIETINLATDLDQLLSADWLNAGMRLKVCEIADLLNDLPTAASVSITSPGELAKELFTYKGSGTLIRRGETIHNLPSFEGADLGAVTRLIEDSFARTLKAGYLANLEIRNILISEKTRALAIMTNLAGEAWLDKFSVAAGAQGEGLGRTMWRHVCESNERFFWRARKDNPIREFYLSESDGHMNQGKWVVFWKGEFDCATLERCIDAAVQRPSSFDAD